MYVLFSQQAAYGVKTNNEESAIQIWSKNSKVLKMFCKSQENVNDWVCI